MRILLVEDAEIAHTIIIRNLQEMGHTVHLAKNGLEAVSMFKAGYDLILLDYGLPILSGIEVAGSIRAYETFACIPPVNIVGITAEGSSIGDKCIAVGFNAVYGKPVKKSDLVKILKLWSPKTRVN